MLAEIGTGGFTAVDYSGMNPLGSQNSPVNMDSSSNFSVRIYRPQRLPFDGEGSALIDMAGLEYTPDIPNHPAGGPGPGRCDAQTKTDTDMAVDAPASGTPSYVEFTWNIDACLNARNTSWIVETLPVDIQVETPGPGGNAAQKIYLNRTFM